MKKDEFMLNFNTKNNLWKFRSNPHFSKKYLFRFHDMGKKNITSKLISDCGSNERLEIRLNSSTKSVIHKKSMNE